MLPSSQERLSLAFSRQYAAPPELVWHAWTEPQALGRWFGPHEIVDVPVAELDVRVGGRYRIVLLEANGARHEVSGVYREVVLHRRLVFTWAWQTTPERESLVTVALQPSEVGTHLYFKHELFFDEAARDRHQRGWKASFERLEAFLGTAGGARRDP